MDNCNHRWVKLEGSSAGPIFCNWGEGDEFGEVCGPREQLYGCWDCEAKELRPERNLYEVEWLYNKGVPVRVVVADSPRDALDVFAAGVCFESVCFETSYQTDTYVLFSLSGKNVAVVKLVGDVELWKKNGLL